MWRPVRSKPGPGCLHSHSAVKFLNAMILFGGEREGQTLNELWKFHFGKCKERSLKWTVYREFVFLALSNPTIQDLQFSSCWVIIYLDVLSFPSFFLKTPRDKK
jgi:hypothetical protein